MKKVLAISTAALAIALFTTSAARAFDFGKSKKEVEVASLDTSSAGAGWMQVLSDDTPVTKPKKQKFNVNASPVQRKLVSFDPSVAPGTIIIDNSDRRLYHVISRGLAVSYGVSVGRDGFRWTGQEVVSAKAEWPAWNPPAEMRKREAKKGHILPERMDGGIDNPLGARAMYLGSTEFRIHGTNQPMSIGKAMSSGCIRMANDDVTHLYQSVKIGTRVIVRD